MREKTMLVVDDLEVNRQLLRITFENEYDILEACDGVEALEIMERNSVDIVVTDIFMERMDGYELIRKIKSRASFQDIPVVAVTENDHASQEDAMEAGADDFITKPFVASVLRMRITSIQNLFRNKQSLVDLNYIFNAIPGGVAIYKVKNDSLALKFCSDGVAALTGRTIAEFYSFVNEHGGTSVYDEDREKFKRTIRECVRNGVSADIIYRLRHKNGSLVWVRFQGSVCGTEDGLPLIRAIYLDISRETQLYRSILDEANIIVHVTDCETREILYANAAASRFGSPELKSFVGEKCYRYIMQKSSPCEFCNVKELSSDRLSSREISVGSRSYRMSGKIITWGGRDAFIEYVEDITEEKRYQAFVREQSDSLRSIIDNIQVGIFVFRCRQGDLTLLGANRAVCALFGISEELKVGIMNDEIYALVSHEDRENLRNVISDLSSEKRYCERTYRFHNIKNGEARWLLVRGKSVGSAEDDMVFYISYTDVTGQIELEERLKESEESLKAAVRHANFYFWEFELESGRAYFGEKMICDFALPESIDDYPEAFLNACRMPQGDRDEFRRITKRAAAGETSVSCNCRCMAAGADEYKWFKVTYSTISDSEGKAVKVIATAQDIHDAKTLEENFVRAERQNGVLTWELDLEAHRQTRIGAPISESDWPAGDVIENVPESIISGGSLHEESVETIKNVYSSVYGGAEQASGQLQGWSEEKRDYVWYELTITAVDDGAGRVRKALCTTRDISTEKQLEQRYKDEQTYRGDLGHSLIANCQVNLTTNVVEALYLGTIELPYEDISTLTDFRSRLSTSLYEIDLTDEEDAEFGAEALLALYRSGVSTVNKKFLARRIDTQMPVLVNTTCHLVRRPNTQNIIAFFYNKDETQSFITSQIAKSVLDEDYDYAGLIFINCGYMMLLSSGSGRTVLPPSLTEDYEAMLKQITARRIEGGEEAVEKMMLDNILKSLRDTPVYTLEMDYRELNGEIRRKRWKFRWSDERRGLLAISRTDIEDIVREERQKQALLAEAARTAEQANEAKSEFLAKMSHEIRTPLNGVMGLAELAGDEDDMATVKRYISQMRLSGTHLSSLVNDILEMSKIENGKIELHPERYTSVDFINNIHAVIDPLCRQKRARFINELNPCPVPVMVDILRFNQIFFNILSNAVKFTDPGGTIRLGAEYRVMKETVKAEYQISDTGIGMSAEFQNKMFEPFAQESSQIIAATQGTGLGLGIAKAYIDLMGGSISVKSERGVGTTFTILMDLPIAPDAPEDESAFSTACGPIDFTGLTVLVAEDHPVNRMIAVKLLQKFGADVTEAEDWASAVKKFSESEPGSIAAILMDIRMPVMDGIEAVKAIRGLKRGDAASVPVIAMTANAFDDDKKSAFLAGMNGFLVKPVSSAELYRELAKFIKRS